MATSEQPAAEQHGASALQAARHGEACLAEDTEGLEDVPKRAVSLKNGSTLDLSIAVATWEFLSSLLNQQPGLFSAALALAGGTEPSPAIRRELRRAVLTREDGTLRPAVREVLLSGYHETAEGPVLTNPIRASDEADRQAFEEMERIASRNDIHLLSRALRSDDRGRT